MMPAGEPLGGTGVSAAAFVEARDFLLAHRRDYETAYRDFRWPVLDRFNWALDYFDPMARGNDRPGLWLVDEGGGETRLTFAELAGLPTGCAPSACAAATACC
jgi:hypothetical protein